MADAGADWRLTGQGSTCSEHRAAIADDPEVLEGYATTGAHAMGADYDWICPACFDDFVQRFNWRVVDSPP